MTRNEYEMSASTRNPENRGVEPTRRAHAAEANLPGCERKWLKYRDSFLGSSPSDKIAKIRTGIEASVLVGAARRLQVSQGELFALVGLTPSTAKRKIGKNETLDPMVTERLTRVAAAEKLAEDVFDDPDQAHVWLLAPNVALGGVAPLSLLDTSMGAQEVSRILNAIAYGMVA